MGSGRLADAVVYEIYPQSFADSNGGGIGDLRGVIDPRTGHYLENFFDAQPALNFGWGSVPDDEPWHGFGDAIVRAVSGDSAD